MFPVKRTLLSIAAALALSSALAAAQSRGLAVVEVKNRAGDRVDLYAESHALVIGVSEYTGGWPRLHGVKKDVPLVKAALEKQGFSVSMVMDPDRDGIDRAFRDFIERYGDKANNRLLFYFAGHGHTMRLAYGGDMGYLVGRDAPNPNVDKAGFKRAALSMQVIETYARNIEAKHALFMFDACFAGAIFDATRAIPEVIREKTGKPVRQFITSGTAEQQVPDESIFRGQFVVALEGEADLDGDGYITGAELGQFLETRVTNFTRRAQTPRYGKLPDPLLSQGDFVFALAKAAAPLPPSPPVRPATGADRTALELSFWESIKDSDDAASFEEFLKQFPAGTFAGLARLRLRRLKAARTAALPPPAVDVEDLDATFVAVKTANLRALPSAAAARVGRLAKGAAVAVTGKVRGRNWYRIAHAGRTAYVHAALVAAADAAEVAAWARVKDSQKASDFEAFLRRFPRGHFAGPARRLAEALKPRVAALAPPKPVVPPAAEKAVGVFPKTFKDCADCPAMVVLPADRFRMGSTTSESGRHAAEGPVHQVRIGRFALGKYEVTKGEFAAFVRGSGYDAGGGCWVAPGDDWKQQASKSWRDPGFGQTDRDPVACVSWDDAKSYVGWLSRKTGKAYRLASESEWEYAARAGTTTARYWGDHAEAACGYGNVADRTAKERYGNWNIHNCRDGRMHTAPVGTYRANGFGVHDMLGNVWEWVEDCWNESYTGAPGNGEAWTTGDCRRRVQRGGAWTVEPGRVRAASRSKDVTANRVYNLGFRVARTY